MKRALIVLTLQIAALMSMASQDRPQDAQAGVKSNVDARSFPELFQKLENKVADAIQAKDTAALEELLAPEFIVRISIDPTKTVSREEWFRSVSKDSGPWHRIRSDQPPLAIRAYGGGVCQASAVVSLLAKQATTPSARGKSYLIIDIWETDSTKTWRLAQRFINQANPAKD